MSLQTVQHVVTNTYTKGQLISMLCMYASEYGEIENVIEALSESLPAQTLLDIAEEFDALGLSDL